VAGQAAVVILTGIFSAALFLFEMLYPRLRKLPCKRIKLKTHMTVGGLSVLMVLLHWITTGFSVRPGFALFALVLFFLTAVSGAFLKLIRRKELKYAHIALSVVTAAALMFHLTENVLTIFFY
jgi:uncharacterized membrane protein YfcA